jgi:hypothetical protein
MDIPVFGWFFRKTTDTLTERTELIIMITPRVMRNADESRVVTDDFRRKLSTVAGEIERMRRGPAKDLPQPKIVVPEKESRLAPEALPESGPRLSRSAAQADDVPVVPARGGPEAAEPAEKPGAMKTIVKFLTFGLVR